MDEFPEQQEHEEVGQLRSKEVIVNEESAGTRLDAYLAKTFTDISRTRIKQLILAGEVMIDGTTIEEPKLRVKPSMAISLTLPPPEGPEPQPQNIPLEIVHEDAQLIVINKPAGMVVHPAPGAPDGTLVNALIYHCGDSLAGIGGVKRPGIVHRLDKNTTGIMVAAKTDRAHKHLSAQFADHGRTGPLTRNYIAFVWGHYQSFAGSINAPLGRDPRNRLKQAVRKDGRVAITHFKTLARYSGEGWFISKIQCTLETGRTHQIRVHMTHVGHPLIGDATYGAGFATKALALSEPLKHIIQSLPRQALHAAHLGFAHPKTKQEVSFNASLPDDLANLEDALQPFLNRTS